MAGKLRAAVGTWQRYGHGEELAPPVMHRSDVYSVIRHKRSSTPPRPLLRGEDGRLYADQCVCGNIFMSDSLFCRNCGVARPYLDSLRKQYTVARENLIKLGTQLDDDGECDVPHCDLCGVEKIEGSSNWFWLSVMVTSFGAKTVFEVQAGPTPQVQAVLGLCATLAVFCGAIIPGLPTSVCSSPFWRVVSKIMLQYLLVLTFLLYWGNPFSRCGGLCDILRYLMWTPLSVGVAYDAIQYLKMGLPLSNTFTGFGDLTCLALAIVYMEFLLETDFGHCQHHDRLSMLSSILLRGSPGLCWFMLMLFNSWGADN